MHRSDILAVGIRCQERLKKIFSKTAESIRSMDKVKWSLVTFGISIFILALNLIILPSAVHAREASTDSVLNQTDDQFSPYGYYDDSMVTGTKYRTFYENDLLRGEDEHDAGTREAKHAYEAAVDGFMDYIGLDIEAAGLECSVELNELSGSAYSENGFVWIIKWQPRDLDKKLQQEDNAEALIGYYSYVLTSGDEPVICLRQYQFRPVKAEGDESTLSDREADDMKDIALNFLVKQGLVENTGEMIYKKISKSGNIVTIWYRLGVYYSYAVDIDISNGKITGFEKRNVI